MRLNLSSYLNQTVSICIPAIDEQARPYKLLGIELYGLWLQGDDPTGGLLVAGADANPPTPITLTAFVPFAQIGCVVVGVAPLVPLVNEAVQQPVATAPQPLTAAQETAAAADGGARGRRVRRKPS